MRKKADVDLWPHMHLGTYATAFTSTHMCRCTCTHLCTHASLPTPSEDGFLGTGVSNCLIITISWTTSLVNNLTRTHTDWVREWSCWSRMCFCLVPNTQKGCSLGVRWLPPRKEARGWWAASCCALYTSLLFGSSTIMLYKCYVGGAS